MKHRVLLYLTLEDFEDRNRDAEWTEPTLAAAIETQRELMLANPGACVVLIPEG